MPLQKPRGRKQSGHNKAYVTAAAVVILVAAVVTYAYLNGFLVPGSNTSSTMSTESNCPAVPAHTNGNYFACIKTSQGSFEVELFTAAAPKTVANFVNLSESGFYDSLVWHRIDVSSTFGVIQTGDPTTRNGGGDRASWGSGGSSVTVPLEVSNTTLHNDRGYLGMARGQDINSGTSQFYVNTISNRGLDGSYTVFGMVISGLDVVDKIAALPTTTQYSSLPQPVNPSQAMLIGVTILNP